MDHLDMVRREIASSRMPQWLLKLSMLNGRPVPFSLLLTRHYNVSLCKCRRPMSCKDSLVRRFWYTVRQWEFEVLREKLLDVWALDVFSLLNLDDTKDL